MPPHQRSELEQQTAGIFRAFISAWVNRDLDMVMSFLHDDVVRNINVDGELVPFAASVVGKAAMRERLQLALDTFEFGSLVTDYLRVEGHVARARMRSIYIHLATGERLTMRFRLVCEQHDGLITRIDGFYDRYYLEAFSRLVNSRKSE